jgi:hypothetical protein
MMFCNLAKPPHALNDNSSQLYMRRRKNPRTEELFYVSVMYLLCIKGANAVSSASGEALGRIRQAGRSALTTVMQTPAEKTRSTSRHCAKEARRKAQSM